MASLLERGRQSTVEHYTAHGCKQARQQHAKGALARDWMNRANTFRSDFARFADGEVGELAVESEVDELELLPTKLENPRLRAELTCVHILCHGT